MDQTVISQISDQTFLDSLLPPEISDQFFEALYGDSSEGAYDIKLEFINASDKRIVLAFTLRQRPGKCLVCSLTYGLPNVFTRHPLINVNGMVKKIEEKGVKVSKWHFGDTEEQSTQLHVIPLYLDLAE